MDVSWTLQSLVPSPQFIGSLVGNDQAAYDALIWLDERQKPTWAELVDAWPTARKTIKPLLDRLVAIFDAIPQTDAPVEVRAYFRQLEGGVRRCLTANPPDVEAAKYIIQTATLPGDIYGPGYLLPQPELGFQQMLLAEF